MRLTMDWKDAFFDRKVVMNAIARETRRAISRSLAFVRTRQRSMLRRRKRVSDPGKPPSVHSRDPVATIKNILFAYDERTKSGVVGMVQVNGRRARIDSGQELPNLLEFGGRMEIYEQSFDGVNWYSPPPRRRRKLQNVKTRKRSARLRPRPSANPALQAEIEAGNILSPWANVVNNG